MVAGVDYYVGLPPGTALADPTTAPLPGGCTVQGSNVTCSSSNVTVSGYDFSLYGGMQLEFESGTTNITVEGNKFGVGANCTTPVSFDDAGGQVSVLHNSFDGAGALCGNGLDLGALISGFYDDGSTLTLEYNVFSNAPEDVTDNGGATTGAAAIVERYNLISMAGWLLRTADIIVTPCSVKA